MYVVGLRVSFLLCSHMITNNSSLLMSMSNLVVTRYQRRFFPSYYVPIRLPIIHHYFVNVKFSRYTLPETIFPSYYVPIQLPIIHHYLRQCQI
jgi:hypothetical protein